MRPIVPVDAKRQDWPRLVSERFKADSQEANALAARVAALELQTALMESQAEETQSRTGYGWADYTDNDAPTVLTLEGGSTVHITRNLSATGANYRLRGPFAGHQFWDNTTNTIQGRALYDAVYISIYMRLTPGASGGVLDVQLMAGAIDIGTKSFEMTGTVGQPKGLRADFKITCRPALLANGAKVMLRSTVTTDLTEFSPEFWAEDAEP